MSETTNPDDLLRLLPPIRRARLWRLYAADGRRFLDLWQDGGRAFLGARSAGLGRELKAAIDVGLGRPFPSALEARLRKDLARRWPRWPVARLYHNEDRALAALAAAGAAGQAAILRPFGGLLEAGGPLPPTCDVEAPQDSSPYALPMLPCPRHAAPGVILAADGTAAEALGPGDLLAPLQLAAALRTLADLDRVDAAALEALWKKADRHLGKAFERRGPWLLPLFAPARHAEAFREALGLGILIPPSPASPALLPGDFDEGEIAGLGKLAAFA
jgi:hypothetical protein